MYRGNASLASSVTALPWINSAIGDLDEFIAVIESGREGLKTGWRRLDRALNGLQPGLHIIAAEANSGKSMLTNQLAWQIVNYNENVHVIDITLDDTKLEKYCRLVAHISGLPINTVKRAGIGKTRDPKIYESVRSTVEILKQAAAKYEVIDGNQAGSVGQMLGLIKSRRVDLLAMENPMQPVVFIDSFHDVLPDIKTSSETGRYDYIAQALSEAANELDIPIVCTAELRKLNGIRRPVLDDIRESVKIRYEAKSVLLCYNDVGSRGENADVFFYHSCDVAKYPVFEAHVAKNKFNSVKGRICFEFIPELAYFREPDDATHRKYLDIINSKNK